MDRATYPRIARAETMTPQDRNIERALARVRNPLTAIRAFCVTCMGGYAHLIPECTAPKCPLFAYRMGRNPNAKARGKFFQPVPSNTSGHANSGVRMSDTASLRAGKAMG